MENENEKKKEQSRQEKGVRVTPPSPGPLSGSSGNVGSSPGSWPVPGRRPWRPDVWECRPERREQWVALVYLRIPISFHCNILLLQHKHYNKNYTITCEY